MIDCKAVVNTMQHFLDYGEEGLNKLAEQDLWDYIFEVCKRQPDFVRVQWMPSHLGESGKEKEKAKAIHNGLVNEEDINGNEEADALAKAGAEKHADNRHHAAAARDRRAITIIVQKMMLQVWEAFLDKSDDAIKEACKGDDEDIYQMLLKAEFEATDEYDTYDPFGAIDQEGCEIGLSQGTNSPDDGTRGMAKNQ
jgi:hypothetical protein